MSEKLSERDRITRTNRELLALLKRYDCVLGVDLRDGVTVYVLSREEADGGGADAHEANRAWLH